MDITKKTTRSTAKKTTRSTAKKTTRSTAKKEETPVVTETEPVVTPTEVLSSDDTKPVTEAAAQSAPEVITPAPPKVLMPIVKKKNPRPAVESRAAKSSPRLDFNLKKIDDLGSFPYREHELFGHCSSKKGAAVND